MYITNVSAFSSKAAATNSLLLMSPTLWVVGNAFAIKYFLHSSFFYINRLFILEKVNKSISKTTSILVSANKNVFLKNRIFSSLFWTENPAMTIL